MNLRSKLGVAGLAVVLSTSGLVGCTADSAPKPTPTSSSSSQLTPGLTDVQDPPGSGDGLVGALADTTVGTCERGDAGWTVSGTVINPTDAAADYRIYVSLLNAANDTRALQQVNEGPVEPKAKSDWSAVVPVEEDGLNCVLRVERYPAVSPESGDPVEP